MQPSRYTVDSQPMPSLLRAQPCFYNETVILNNTRYNIVMVDYRNNRVVIPAMMNGYSVEEVIIYDRGAMQSMINDRGEHVPATGYVYRISLRELIREPLFISEVNCVLCTEDLSSQVMHPYGCVTYSEALSQAVLQLTEVLGDSPSIMLEANDPEGRASEIYTAIGTRVVPIPVSNIYDRAANLSMSVIQNGTTFQVDVSLDDLFKAEDEFIELETGIFPFVCIRRSRCAQLVKQYKPLTNKQLEKITKESEYRIKQQASDFAEKLKSLKDEYEIKLQSSENTVTALKEDNKKLQRALDTTEAKYAAAKGAMFAHTDFAKEEHADKEMHHKTAELRYKEETAGVKYDQAKLEHEEARWKVIGTCATLVLGGIGFKVLSYAWEKFTESNPPTKALSLCVPHAFRYIGMN